LRNEAVAVILVIAIIGSAAVGYFAGVSTHQTTMSVSTVTIYGHTSTYTSPVSSSGLQLRIELNSTSIQYRGALSATVALWNTLSSNLSLTPRYSSVLSSWESNDFFCGKLPRLG